MDHFKCVPFTCSKCPMQFDTKSRLNVHFKCHSTELKYKCNKCDAVFTKNGSLYFHKQNVHGIASFVCEHCAKTFKFKSKLALHVQTKHAKIEQTYVCDECGKVNFNEKTAKDHARIHKNIGTFVCPYADCDGKTFKRVDLLNSHIRTVHSSTEKNYPCEFCQMKFKTMGYVKKHETQVHLRGKTLKCDLCDFAAKTHSHLSVHKKSIHEGIVYHCDYPGCLKSYNRKENLNCHKKTAHKIPRPNDLKSKTA